MKQTFLLKSISLCTFVNKKMYTYSVYTVYIHFVFINKNTYKYMNLGNFNMYLFIIINIFY